MSDDNNVDINDPKVQEAIRKAVDSEVTGLKTKNNDLIAAQKNLKEQLKAFDGIDPEKTKALLKRFENDEEAQLIAEGKIDEVITRRTDRMRSNFEKQLEEANGKADAASKKAAALVDQVRDDFIRQAGVKAGLLPEAIEDAVFRGRGVFSLNDDAKPQALNGDELILGADGKTALTPQEWLEGLRETSPHWWPKAAGSGAGGDGNSSGNGKSVTRADFDQMSPDERSGFMKEGGKITD